MVPQAFGGPWTEKKLQVLEGYLKAYLTALKDQPWIREKVYIDAFAGTGSRRVEHGGSPRSDSPGQELLMPELAEPATTAFLDGSAKKALGLDPPFDRYIFIEKAKRKTEKLHDLVKATGARNTEVRPGDANTELRQIAASWHPKDLGVVFLDPFGMTLDWETMEALARTKALDVWLLFPLGQAVSRMLVKADRTMPDGWEHRLTVFFGTEGWRDAFYPREVAVGLFGEEESVLRRASYDRIEAFFRKRLREAFPWVHSHTLEMKNDRGVPLFLLFFMMATPNKKAWTIGEKVANHLFKLHD